MSDNKPVPYGSRNEAEIKPKVRPVQVTVQVSREHLQAAAQQLGKRG